MGLFLATIATALHFHAWWWMLSILKREVLGNPVFQSTYDILIEVVFCALGFLLQVVLGVGSGNQYGVCFESKRDENGILLPFFYFTYIYRKEEVQETGLDLV